MLECKECGKVVSHGELNRYGQCFGCDVKIATMVYTITVKEVKTNERK